MAESWVLMNANQVHKGPVYLVSLRAPFNIINDLLIRAQEGMQLVVAMILHVKFY